MNKLKPRTIKALFAAIISAAVPVAAVASSNPFGSLRGCHEVSDQTLSHMRGRYVAFGKVAYFGVEMQTVWTTASGTVLHSGADFQIDLSHSTPTVGYSTSTSIHNPNNATPHGPPSGDTPPTTGQGVVQTIQVSSNGNTATNNIGVDVTDQALTNGIGAGAKNSTTAVNGMSAQATVNKDGSLVTEITVPGEGAVRQVIMGNSLASGMFQNVMLSGPSNQVQNNLVVTVGVNPSSGARPVVSIPLTNMLGTMMGVPRIGG